MSAMTGIGERATISSSAAASLSRGTATRTSSHPASTILPICSRVASTSLVSVFVIDWPTTGGPPPIGTFFTQIWRFEAMNRWYRAAAASKLLRSTAPAGCGIPGLDLRPDADPPRVLACVAGVVAGGNGDDRRDTSAELQCPADLAACLLGD